VSLCAQLLQCIIVCRHWPHAGKRLAVALRRTLEDAAGYIRMYVLGDAELHGKFGEQLRAFVRCLRGGARRQEERGALAAEPDTRRMLAAARAHGPGV
jgi:hypothetical protein